MLLIIIIIYFTINYIVALNLLKDSNTEHENEPLRIILPGCLLVLLFGSIVWTLEIPFWLYDRILDGKR